MSTQAQLADTLELDGQVWYVVRVVESTTWFQDSEESYLLEEKYVELRSFQTGEVGFKVFSQRKHPGPTIDGRPGLNPKIWRKM